MKEITSQVINHNNKHTTYIHDPVDLIFFFPHYPELVIETRIYALDHSLALPPDKDINQR